MTIEQIDYKAKLVSAKVKCPDIEKSWHNFSGVPHYLCFGTGKVFLLPDETGVRVRCDGIGYADHEDSPKDCRFCHGLGYTPTQDNDKLAQAVWPLLINNNPVSA